MFTPRRARRATASVEPRVPLHAVEFYDDETALVDHLERYVREGARRGEKTVVIATPAHREALSERLAADPEEFVGLDAQETLELFMVGGLPDPDRFEDSIGTMVRAEAEVGVRAYGEMVALLWEQDNVEGTIALEQLWNGLQEQVSFPLLCAYPMSDFEQRKGIARICGTHNHVDLPPLEQRIGA